MAKIFFSDIQSVTLNYHTPSRKQNSTLGSVVPLAVFRIIDRGPEKKKSIFSRRFGLTNVSRKVYLKVVLLTMRVAHQLVPALRPDVTPRLGLLAWWQCVPLAHLQLLKILYAKMKRVKNKSAKCKKKEV